MKYFQRSLAAAVAVFVLLSSILILPASASARTKRCPEPIPDSLLTLYMKSDLVVIASLESEKFLKTTQEYDYGLYYDVEKTLDIDETFKGKKIDSAAMKVSEYKAKKSEESEAMANEEDEHSLKIGEKALFFLVKDAESGYYDVAHYSAAIKQLNDADLNLYEKRIKELKSILAKDKDRHARLAEWLVRLIEEPATREEGVRDLLASFTLSDYGDEYVEEVTDVKENVEEHAEESAEAKTEEAANKKPVPFDKNFRTSKAPEIAAALTDSQKSRVSNILFAILSNDLTKLNDAENEEYIYPADELISLVARWDKQNFAMNMFANLQNSGGASQRKNVYLMRAVANFLADDDLYIIADDYEYAASQDEAAEIDYTGSTLEDLLKRVDAENAAIPETVSDSVENTGTAMENPPVISDMEDQKLPDVSPETGAPVLVNPAEKPAEDTAEKIIVKMTYGQYRAKLFDAFNAQYGRVISQTTAAKKQTKTESDLF